MIQVKPNVENCFVCPVCRSDSPIVQQVLVQSMHTMAECTCGSCNFEFYQIFPIGHHVEDQLSVSKSNDNFYRHPKTQTWLFDTLVKAHKGTRRQDAKIEKRVFKNCEHVVILNTLDYLYGHVLLKLYNAFHHLGEKNELGLIVIIPKIFEWLIPQGCAEAWIVDLKLNDLAYNQESVQKFVSSQFSRFNSIYISRAYSHPDFSNIDISRLTGIKPFELAGFSQRRPTVTFVLREDRWWLGSIADYWFYRICRKLKILTWGRRVLSLRQNQLVKSTIENLRKKLPSVDFYIAGLGRTGSYRGYGVDERKTIIDASVEIAWCRIYAASHVVVGVHGSNMLLPTAFAAGCVEILPEDRYGNMVQDLSVRYNDRRQLFFYRFADQYASPRSVAGKVAAMIDDYDIYHKNMCRNVYLP